MNTPLKKYPIVKAHQQWPMPQKASEPPDAVWPRQSCVEASADEVSCGKIDRRSLMAIGLLAGWLTVALMAGGCAKQAVKDPRLQVSQGGGFQGGSGWLDSQNLHRDRGSPGAKRLGLSSRGKNPGAIRRCGTAGPERPAPDAA